MDEIKILSKLEESLSVGHILIRNYVDDGKHCSAIITEGGFPYCFIDVKDFSEENQEDIKIKVNNAKAKFAIITNGETYWFLNKEKNNDFEELGYDDIIKILSGEDIRKKISGYFSKNLRFNIEEKNIIVDTTLKTVTLESTKELIFINQHFGFQELSDYTIYRYTSLNNVSSMLIDGKIKMFGPAGMNDISEINYVEKILYPADILNKLSGSTKDEINNMFIMSCSINKEDDLTQWRLYADDAKGARLRFELNKNECNGINNDKGKFSFQKIRYIDENCSEIKHLRSLIEFVSKYEYTFVFKSLHAWCHFIKPADYEIESEARLLYRLPDSNSESNPEKWILAKGTNIMNPYIEFELTKEFPLQLKDIKLGPKCPEKETNQFQLEALMKNKEKFRGITVQQSTIKHYR